VVTNAISKSWDNGFDRRGTFTQLAAILQAAITRLMFFDDARQKASVVVRMFSASRQP